ncbi:MAG: 2-oxo-4-hydroxy-4-carboxy-5-ureidoimidazoline decarboxylase [bacterium]
MNLDEFNGMSRPDAEAVLTQCCSAARWVEQLIELRPFDSQSALLQSAESCWASMQEKDLLEAFEGHPKIGDPESLKRKFANTKNLASNEQSEVQRASEQTILELASCNQEYVDKHGFIFIICATGKSADEMLVSIKERLGNNREQELLQAAIEQQKITALRLRKLIDN